MGFLPHLIGIWPCFTSLFLPSYNYYDFKCLLIQERRAKLHQPTLARQSLYFLIFLLVLSG